MQTRRYEYDANNRLTLAYDEDGAVSYEYDAAGNLTRKTDELAGCVVESYYAYDGYNRLKWLLSGDTEATYTYNPEGLRETKTVNGQPTRFLYDDDSVVGELTADNECIYHRAEAWLAVTASSGERLYCGLNTQGSVTTLTDDAGTQAAAYSYDPYGREQTFSLAPTGEQTAVLRWMAETDATHNPFRYCGEYYDAESGFIYLRNRYYDPSTGRFITEDPAKDGVNWYVYCEGNPINFVDPSGCFRIIDGKSYDKYKLGSGNVYNQVNDYASMDIKKMQIKLQELGYLEKTINSYGYFGSQTLEAVNKFKEANHLQNNTKETKGVVGATTWALMGLDFDIIESVGATASNVTMDRGVLRVDRNIINADISNVYYAASAIKDSYKIVFGDEFRVTTDSVYWEIIGHIFADEVAETHKGGLLDPLWERIQRSTGTIDIGDNIICPDGNRKIWDWLAGQRRFPW